MAQIRLGQASDLPQLTWLAAQNAWGLLHEEQKKGGAAFPTVAQAAQANLIGTLSTPGGIVLVVDVGGQIGGYLLVGIGPDGVTGEPFGYMADIWVHPQLRQRGVASTLLQLAEEYCRSLGVFQAKLWTHAHNAASQRVAARHGYAPDGIVWARNLQQPVGALPGQTFVQQPLGALAGQTFVKQPLGALASQGFVQQPLGALAGGVVSPQPAIW